MYTEGSSPTPEQIQRDSEALARRKQGINNILKDPTLQNWNCDQNLKNGWLVWLQNQLDPAIARTRKWGRHTALVLQFTDAGLGYRPDADFVNAFLDKFGAHITNPDGNSRMAVNATSVKALTQAKNLNNIMEKGTLAEKIDGMPKGSLLITDEQRRNKYLIVETNLEGVRIVFDGPAIFQPQQPEGPIRAMLLVDIGHSQGEETTPEDQTAKVDRRKTWTEVHGREPSSHQSSKPDHAERLRSTAAISGSDEELEVADLHKAWRSEPLPGDKILVTPAVLRENPALQTNEERISVVAEALKTAVTHMRLDEQGKARPVVGQTTYAISIMTELLGMTPGEIARDGEAMSDLVEYLEEAAAEGSSTGPSSILGPPPENHLYSQIVKKIRDTWEFPEHVGLQQPFMYSRISWQKSQPQNPTNN